jgi:uncharacterized protein RhaS with RHS repeats
MRARYYEPTSGRFVSEDPARDGLSWFAYCGNNPVTKCDPTGKEFMDGYSVLGLGLFVFVISMMHMDTADIVKNINDLRSAYFKAAQFFNRFPPLDGTLLGLIIVTSVIAYAGSLTVQASAKLLGAVKRLAAGLSLAVLGGMLLALGEDLFDVIGAEGVQTWLQGSTKRIMSP